MSRVEIIGDATLYLGDARKVLPTLGKGFRVLSDPPYGMDYKSGHNSGRKGAGAKMARKDGNFEPIAGDKEPFDPATLLALDGPAIIWGANYFNDKLPAGRRWLVWNKLVGKTPLPSGSDLEMAWCSERGPDRVFDHLWRGIMRAGEENVTHSAKHHPNQKPVALMSWCLQFLPGEAPIIDPYMGSGTSGVAAIRAGQRFVGVELEEEHFETACRRIAEAVAQPRLFARETPAASDANLDVRERRSMTPVRPPRAAITPTPAEPTDASAAQAAGGER